jgi:hypothetical protein
MNAIRSGADAAMGHSGSDAALPIAYLIVGWWIWKDLKPAIDRWRRDRETRSMIIGQRLDRLEERMMELENRLDDHR